MNPIPTAPTPRTVGILIFPDVEVLDFCGPFEVFSVTRVDGAKRRETESPFHVLLVSETLDPVRATGGLRALPDVRRVDCPALDLLVIPGGWGTRAGLHNAGLVEWIAARARTAGLTMSVCTGSLLLGKAGLLQGRRATTHWASLDALAKLAPTASVVRDEHVVEDGADLVTTAGISAGIDGALRVVARLHGEPVARETARYMEYPFPEDNRRRV